MVLVDTSVWIDYFNGVITPETDALNRLFSTARLLIGDLILAEVLQGFAREADFHRARRFLLDVPCVDLVGRDLALVAAANYRTLRTRGVTVRKTIDMLIGSYCIAAGHELLHADRDFDALEKHLGLRIARV